jgi:hypothetical protein
MAFEEPTAAEAFAAQAWADGRTYSAWVEIARMNRADAIARRMPNRVSLTLAARDYGLVPHVMDYIRANGCCLDAQRRLMLAASVLRYRNAHRDGIYGMTVMEEVRA